MTSGNVRLRAPPDAPAAATARAHARRRGARLAPETSNADRLACELAQVRAERVAVSEILQVIAGSPCDVRSVFDTIVRHAVGMCGSLFANVFRFDGEQLHFAASFNTGPGYVELLHSKYPMVPDRSQVAGRVALAGRVVALDDAWEDPEYDQRFCRALGWHRMVGVPLMRDGRVLGVLVLGWAEAGPVAAGQAQLLQTFADQAVIALDNVRLFNEVQARNLELTQALEQQTVTSDILRVINRSRTDVQPVFDAIVASAARLCEAQFAFVLLEQGGRLALCARTACTPEFAAFLAGGKAANAGSTTGRAALARRTVQVVDFLNEPGMAVTPAHRAEGVRTVLAVPMLRDEELLGVIAVWRREVRMFTDRQVRLLETFASQAVIAVENARLLEALQSRTTDLTRSVQQLRALADVGQAVSSTLDLPTVLSTIASRAVDLTGTDGCVIYEYDEVAAEFRLRAADRVPDELVEALRSPPIPKGEGAVGRLALGAEPVQIADTLDERAYSARVRDLVLRSGYRSLLAVPLLREDRLLGGLVVNRRTSGAFEPTMIELLKAFATQSALAIQNARLFREIATKGRELEIASRHKSAFLANMSHELRTPLNAIIGFTRIVMRKSQERLEPRQLENLEKILSSASHLLSLINAVLDLAKVEAGRIELHLGNVRPALLLEQCLRTVEPLVREGVALERSFGDDLPDVVADEEKLRQIVINLLSNAARFTAAGCIELAARSAGDVLEVAVADTGTGIPADKLDAIFEEFAQADSSTTRTHGGTGLGLAIARRLARLMGGDIGVRSMPGAGSTFTLTLPRPH